MWSHCPPQRIVRPSRWYLRSSASICVPCPLGVGGSSKRDACPTLRSRTPKTQHRPPHPFAVSGSSKRDAYPTLRSREPTAPSVLHRKGRQARHLRYSPSPRTDHAVRSPSQGAASETLALLSVPENRPRRPFSIARGGKRDTCATLRPREPTTPSVLHRKGPQARRLRYSPSPRTDHRPARLFSIATGRKRDACATLRPREPTTPSVLHRNGAQARRLRYSPSPRTENREPTTHHRPPAYRASFAHRKPNAMPLCSGRKLLRLAHVMSFAPLR